MSKLSTLTKLLDRLDEEDIHYNLSSVREGTVLVGVTIPEERWEIEFSADGDIEVEIFKSDGAIKGAEAIKELFERAADDD